MEIVEQQNNFYDKCFMIKSYNIGCGAELKSKEFIILIKAMMKKI